MYVSVNGARLFFDIAGSGLGATEVENTLTIER